MFCATYNIPKRFLKNKGENLFTYVVGRDNISCGPHSNFIYEASKIIRNKVASHKLWAMITQVVGYRGGVVVLVVVVEVLLLVVLLVVVMVVVVFLFLF